MKRSSSRPGSALLIVLGMLAFMVISAVAFSAYMRYARMPSSFLRRSSASRMLVKAAVARAIDAIDNAIANDQHPGVGAYANERNHWVGRVLIGQNSLVDYDETVPVLTLESLAYIPPALVNEARYYSRRSPAAGWHSFGFDSGRYAFCALDVSDCFDVNRLVADYPRSSASNRRVTLGYLFEKGMEHTAAGDGASKWDTFMEDFRTVDDETLTVKYGTKVPLVSVADLNLAMRDQTFGSLKSPFYNYVWGSPDNGFYNGTSPEDEDAMSRMMFVTDSWFPQTQQQATGSSQSTKIYDLGGGANQPYSASTLCTKSSPPKLSTTVLGTAINGAVKNEFLNRLSGLGCAALADYLDVDRVPVSLAIPTTERVPMICGVQPMITGGPSFGIEINNGSIGGINGSELVPDNGNVNERDVEQTVRYKIRAGDFAKAFLGAQVRPVLAFPFLHGEGDDTGWTLDGKFCFFLSSGAQMPLRTGNASDVLHFANNNAANTGLDANTGVLTVKLDGARPTFPANITDPKNAMWDSIGVLPLDAGLTAAQSLNNNGNELLSITYQWHQTKVTDPQSGEISWTPEFSQVLGNQALRTGVKAHCAMRPLVGSGGSIGSVDPDFKDDTALAAKVADPTWSKHLYLNAAVWLRVKNKDGKVVDMVPACVSDDKNQNQINDPDTRIEIIGRDEFAGSPYPVLRFGTGVDFNYGAEALKDLATAKSIELTPKALMVADPRFNYAPEHWFAVDNDIDGNSWLQNNLVGENNRNRDIFLATSDAGYMQSIYELAFLPRFTDLNSYGGSLASGNMSSPNSRNRYGTSAADALNSGLMWRSYDPFDLDEAAFDNLPFTSAGTGMKINPYSDSTNVMMAAFANTPTDWRRASSNYVSGVGMKDYASMTAKAFNQSYAWNAYGAADTKVDWEDLELVAREFMFQVRNSANHYSWKEAWQEMGWAGASKTDELLEGITFESSAKFYDCDRKFLYGFWRDCFAAKQQLFLVFVRAEPMMMGGGKIGQTPPQLGGRAVALVWRDPTETSTSGSSSSGSSTTGYPHRTRVLFYRQFE